MLALFVTQYAKLAMLGRVMIVNHAHQTHFWLIQLVFATVNFTDHNIIACLAIKFVMNVMGHSALAAFASTMEYGKDANVLKDNFGTKDVTIVIQVAFSATEQITLDARCAMDTYYMVFVLVNVQEDLIEIRLTVLILKNFHFHSILIVYSLF